MNSFIKFISSSLRRMLRATPALLVLIPLVSVSGQKPSARQAEEMKKLDFLVGEWEGKGQEFRSDGSLLNVFSEKVKVQAKAEADGATLHVKGESSFKPLAQEGRPLYHYSSFEATIYYDEVANLYRWQGGNQSRRNYGLEAKLIGVRTLQYGIPFTMPISLVPHDGTRKTTIEITEGGEWHQTLEVWKEGRWFKSEESFLKKVK